MTEHRHMTVGEVALVREIVQWRRRRGCEFIKRRVSGPPFWRDRETRREVWVTPDEAYPIGAYGAGTINGTLPAASVTQAVDILVALEYLPQRFSSAYRAGWEAAAACLRGVVRRSWASDIRCDADPTSWADDLDGPDECPGFPAHPRPGDAGAHSA